MKSYYDEKHSSKKKFEVYYGEEYSSNKKYKVVMVESISQKRNKKSYLRIKDYIITLFFVVSIIWINYYYIRPLIFYYTINIFNSFFIKIVFWTVITKTKEHRHKSTSTVIICGFLNRSYSYIHFIQTISGM